MEKRPRTGEGKSDARHVASKNASFCKITKDYGVTFILFSTRRDSLSLWETKTRVLRARARACVCMCVCGVLVLFGYRILMNSSRARKRISREGIRPDRIPLKADIDKAH